MSRSVRGSSTHRVRLALVASLALVAAAVGGGAIPAQAAGSPYVAANLMALGGPSQILAVDFPVGASVTVWVDFGNDGGPLGGFDFEQTLTAVEGTTSFDLGGSGLLNPGDRVVAADGTSTKELVLADVRVEGVNTATGQVNGVAPDGSDVTVDPSAYGPGDPPQTQTVSGGAFAFTFANIVPGQMGSAYVTDGEGDRTVNDWQAPASQLVVGTRFNGVEGWNFDAGGNVTIRVSDDATTPTLLVEASAGVAADGRFLHSFVGFDLQPGMWIEVTDGTSTKDVVASSLEVWGSDPTAGTVYGSAEPASTVTVKTIEDPSCWRNVEADVNGHWLVDFGTADPSSQPPNCTLAVPFDTPLGGDGQPTGVYGDTFQVDGDGDWTGHEGWAPSRINVSSWADRVAGIGSSFRVGADVTITIDDPSTVPEPDVTAHAIAGSAGPNQFELCTAQGIQVGMFGCTAIGGPIDIRPGFLVTATDGTTTKTEVVTGLAVTGTSTNPSSVHGTAAPGSEVLVATHGSPGSHQRTVVADPQGNWTADFSSPQGGDPPYQFPPNTTGDAFQLELVGAVDGDETSQYWSVGPYLDVLPSVGLQDGQMVQIRGANWPANKTMQVNMCVLGVPFSGTTCDGGTIQELTTNPDGSVVGWYQVQRNITTEDTGPVDCAAAPGSCGLVGVVWHGRPGHPEDGISLDTPGNNPVSFGAYIEVMPDVGLQDGQPVGITGAGWLPNKTVYVVECAVGFGGPNPEVCDLSTQQQLTSGPDGSLSGQFTVSRTITLTLGGETGPYSCVSSENGCGLAAVQWHGTEGVPEEGITLVSPASNPIHFASYVDVVPSSNLLEGQMVTISGAGWPAGKPMYLTECALGFSLSPDSCDPSTRQQLMTAADGTVWGLYRVSRSIFTADTGVRDCAGVGPRCGLVAVVWHGDEGDVSQGITIDFPDGNPLGFALTSDSTAPSITIKSPTDGAIYPEHKTVAAAYSCTDKGGSLLASCIGDVANRTPIDTSTIGAQIFNVMARDRAGNLAVRTQHYTVLDRTPPMISLAMPTAGATYTKGSFVPASYSCFDTGSGIWSCLGTVSNGSPIDTSSIGPKTFVVTAIDNAGNVTQATATYTVVYPWFGFSRGPDAIADPPAINPGGTAGSRLDVSFDLGGNHGLPVTSSVKSRQLDCAFGSPIGRTESATATVSFNSATGKYLVLWTTKTSWAGSCRQLQITLKDGTSHSVSFDFD